MPGCDFIVGTPPALDAACNLLNKTRVESGFMTTGGIDMTQARVVLVPFQGPVRKRRLDLALALAILGRAVKLHERAERARHAGGTLDASQHVLAGSEHAKLGA